MKRIITYLLLLSFSPHAAAEPAPAPATQSKPAALQPKPAGLKPKTATTDKKPPAAPAASGSQQSKSSPSLKTQVTPLEQKAPAPRKTRKMPPSPRHQAGSFIDRDGDGINDGEEHRFRRRNHSDRGRDSDRKHGFRRQQRQGWGTKGANSTGGK